MKPSLKADLIIHYLNERGHYDPRKSEERRFKIKHSVSSRNPVWLNKYDLIRNKDLANSKSITNLVNSIFSGNR